MLDETVELVGLELPQRTSGGRVRDLFRLTREDLDIVDIATSLAQINRFAGQSQFPWSVAAHSVLVSRLAPAGLALAGLMHDATESFVGDMIGPVKRKCKSFEAIEARVLRQLQALSLDFLHTEAPEVKTADKLAYRIEYAVLQKGGQDHRIQELHWRDARGMFLARYKELGGSL